MIDDPKNRRMKLLSAKSSMVIAAQLPSIGEMELFSIVNEAAENEHNSSVCVMIGDTLVRFCTAYQLPLVPNMLIRANIKTASDYRDWKRNLLLADYAKWRNGESAWSPRWQAEFFGLTVEHDQAAIIRDKFLVLKKAAQATADQAAAMKKATERLYELSLALTRLRDGAPIATDAFLALCKQFDVALHPRTVGLINKSVRTVQEGSVGFNKAGGKPTPSFTKVFEAVKALLEASKEEVLPTEAEQKDLDHLFGVKA